MAKRRRRKITMRSPSKPSKVTKEPEIVRTEQAFSFDLDTVLYLSGLDFEQRMLVQKRMVEVAENKKCIPVSVAKAVVKEMGFTVKPREDEA